jgi:transposase
MINSTNLKSILLLAANPKKTPNLRLQEEEREIRQRLRMAGYARVPIHSTGATRYRDIQQAMVDFNPQIVHFSGHGAGEDGLVFEDAGGQEALVSSEALANLFRIFSTEGLECVVLNACHTRFQAEAIAKHIDYVIGTNQSIKDTDAIEFAVGFYTGIGAGKTIDFAFELGCNAVELAEIKNQPIQIFYLYNQGKMERVVLQFVHKALQNGTHPIRNQEVKSALKNTYSEDEIERAIQNLLKKRELREERAGQLSISDLGKSRLRARSSDETRWEQPLPTPPPSEDETSIERALRLLKKMSSTKFREVIFCYKIPESYISINKPQVEQAIEVINYANEKEGEYLTNLLSLIAKIISA